MVKRNIESAISEDHSEAHGLNENGKRSALDQNKEGTKKLKTKGWFRQPTANELNRLQETENLFNSNLFRLQVDEILEEVKLKEKTEKKFTEWFEGFKNHLLEIPDDDTEYDLSEETLCKQLKVKLPVSIELKKTRCTFKFHKFQAVEIVGSYTLGCAINSKLKIDVQITVPAETYSKNDSINYRYHKKRAAYLAFIASHLNKFNSIEDLQYSWLNGCETKPVLDIKPAGKLGNHLSVRLNLVCEQEAYKFHRFSSARNNLREAWLSSSEVESNAGSNEVGPPTPFYNSSILSDLTASANQEFINEILSKGDNLKQAVVLLKIWLRQRNLQVSGHVVSCLVAYFVQNKRINNIMSSYQIVRNIWIALKTLELDCKGISLHKGEPPVPIDSFHEHFPVVFLDCTGYYNLCWDMCKGTYQALKRECEMAVEILDNGKINSFTPLFMTPVKPLLQFDHILKFKNYDTLKSTVLSKAPVSTKVNYGVNRLALVRDTLHSLLSKGLGLRADLILQLVEADFSWPVNKTAEKVKSKGYEEKLSFGLILNPEHSMNTIDKGPPANLPAAEQFRAFWGDKSELRRFQDGSITETCVWGGDSAAERRQLTTKIVNYLLELKYGIPSSDLFHFSNQLDSLTARKQFIKSSLIYVEESSLEALQAFDALRRDLRQLTELPLDISAVYGTSPVFSYSAPLPAVPAPPPRAPWRRGHTAAVKDVPPTDELVLPHYIPVASAVLELGHSGKWPGDIEALRCLKAAFHAQIAERLRRQYALPAQASPGHVDVLKHGLVFRLAIAHPKEITLLRKEVEGGVAKYRESEESVRLQCDTVLMPRLRGALHGLHQKHASFGPTVCLFKRWLSAHLLSPHFPPTLAELVCAAVYVRSAPHAAPVCPTVGLARVLNYVGGTDWEGEVVVLDFNEDMTREELSAIEQQLASDPARPPLCIATAYDGALPAVWTRGLTTAVANRTRALAASALTYMQRQLDSCGHLLGAFVPSLSGYDVLIHLHARLVPYVCERPDKTPELRPLPDKVAEDIIPIVEFNPVRNYLEDLRSAYNDFALFFHDQYGGEVIAVLWKPEVEGFKDFQLLSANALTPVVVQGETKYKVNKAAIVEDFRILGDGLVKDITVT